MAKKGPVKTFFSYTLGPVTMIKQSFGTSSGQTIKTQYQEWAAKQKEFDYDDAVRNAGSYNFAERIKAQGLTEQDVRKGYRATSVILASLWAGIAYCVGAAFIGQTSLTNTAIMMFTAVALMVAMTGAAHRQICVRHKTFYSIKEVLALMAANPLEAAPRRLPRGWVVKSKQ